MEADRTVLCMLLAIDLNDYCYRVCSRCERVLPEESNGVSSSTSEICRFCNLEEPKRLYRILMSIATDTAVKTVICFDRTAKVLFGCSANEFFHFTNTNLSAGSMVNQVLEGEMLRMTLARPHNSNAQHMRVTSLVPLRSGFQPAIATLRALCTKTASSEDLHVNKRARTTNDSF